MFGDSYVTAAEFQSAVLGLDLSTYTDPELTTILARASRAAEAEAQAVWAVKDDDDGWAPAPYTEKQEWRPGSRRAYLRHWPVTEITSAKIWIGANLCATLTVSDFIINNTQHYVELASMASATTLTPDLLTLGISEPVIEITYKAGYSSIPEDVKLAICLTAGAVIAQTELLREGIGGIRSFVIGTYSVTVGRGEGAPAGFANLMPDAAKDLLNDYRFTSLR